MMRLRPILAGVSLAIALARPGATCEVALVLAMDVSGSINAEHYVLQRDGTAEALRGPAVAAATRGGLAVSALMWGSGQHPVMGWRVLRAPADALRAADVLAAVARPEAGSTDVASALRAAVALFDALPCPAERRVVDISGDGRHQGDAADVSAAVAQALAAGVEVNALPIVTPQEPGVADWYREHVTGPAGGFAIPADWPGFGRAIRMKLSMEIAAR